jgi:hypothetical protein
MRACYHKTTPIMQWKIIEQSLSTIKHASSGYTLAHRGTITLGDGQTVFVKLGVDDTTNAWAQKEIALYELLSSYRYPHIPKLLAVSPERTAFCLEALVPQDGWDWTNTWSHERLDATLAAIDELAGIQPSIDELSIFGTKGLSEKDDGWKTLSAQPDKQAVLEEKLKKAGHHAYMKNVDYAAMAAESALFVFKNAKLVHYDIRADNCAWNPHTNAVRLIDWNWAQIGDERIDTVSMLVHIHRAGLDISRHYDRLDAHALLWVAGLWLNAAATPLWPGGSEHTGLRDYQLESGIAALKLRDTLLR